MCRAGEDRRGSGAEGLCPGRNGPLPPTVSRLAARGRSRRYRFAPVWSGCRTGRTSPPGAGWSRRCPCRAPRGNSRLRRPPRSRFEEPPGLRRRSGCHGLTVGPKQDVLPLTWAASSSRLVLPKMTAPAARRRATATASAFAGAAWVEQGARHCGGQAAHVDIVLDHKGGMPWSGPRKEP